MFNLKRGSSKPYKRKPLIGLALEDGEWVVEKSTAQSIDHVEKVIKSRMDDLEGMAYKFMKLNAVVRAKYGKPRKMAGVSHMRQYIKSAIDFSCDWYVAKKANSYVSDRWGDRTRWDGNIITYYSEIVYSEKDLRFIADWFAKQVPLGQPDYAQLLNYISSQPGLTAKILNGSNYGMQNMMEEALFGEYAVEDSKYLKRIYNEFKEILAEGYKQMLSTRADAMDVSNKKIKQVAQYLHDELEKLSEKEILMPSELMQASEFDIDGLDVLDDEDMEDLESVVRDMMRRDSSKEYKWGNMNIVKPRLDRRLPTKLQTVAKKKSDMGVKPSAMNRYATDKKIFTNKTKRDGGTVLIDVSGSMYLDEEDIEELIHTLPAGTVAMYYGYDTEDLEMIPYDGNVSHGSLCILAENGKYVGNIPEHGKQNIVDGPALDWLSTQQEPRIIVSDLQVSGIRPNNNKFGKMTDCEFNQPLMADALQKIKKGNIIPIPNIDKAKEWAKAYVNKT